MTRSKPSVDVLLPTYNGERFVAEAIRSVLEQTIPDWRLIVIDDGSTDATPQIVEAAAASDPRIHLLHSDRRRAAGARMIGAAHGDAPHLAFIDQDDRWRPEKLRRQLELLETGGFDAAHAAVCHIDESGQELRWAAWEENHYRSRHASGPEGLSAEQLCVRSSVRLASGIVSREAFDAVGGFDTSLFGGEDWSFWLDVVASGRKLGYVDVVLVERRVHSANTSTAKRSDRRPGLRAAVERAAQRHPELEPALCTRRAVVSFGDAGRHLTEGRPGDALAATRLGLRHLGQGDVRTVVGYAAETAGRRLLGRLARLSSRRRRPEGRPRT